jgi:hypothetical protein
MAQPLKHFWWHFIFLISLFNFNSWQRSVSSLTFHKTRRYRTILQENILPQNFWWISWAPNRLLEAHLKKRILFRCWANRILQIISEMWVTCFLPFYVGWTSVYLGLLFSWWLLNMTSRRSSYMDFVNSQVLWRYRRRNSTWSQCSFTDCPHEYPARQCRLLSGSTFGRFEVFL